jgi:hypothetical protein
MRQLSGPINVKSAVPPVVLKVMHSLKKVDVQTTLLAISITVVVRGFYDESTLMSTHYLHFVRIPL